MDKNYTFCSKSAKNYITKNKLNFIFSLLLTLGILMLSGCPGIQESVSLSNDKAIEIISPDNVVVYKGETTTLKVTLNIKTIDKLLDSVIYELDNKDIVNITKKAEGTFEITGLNTGTTNLKLSLQGKNKVVKIEVKDKTPSSSTSNQSRFKPVLISNTGIPPVETPTPTVSPVITPTPNPSAAIDNIEIIAIPANLSLCQNQDGELRVRLTNKNGKAVNKEIKYELSNAGILKIEKTDITSGTTTFKIRAKDTGTVTLKLIVANTVKEVKIDVSGCGGSTPQVILPPDAPAGLTAPGGDIAYNAFKLTWNAVDGATGYKIYTGDDPVSVNAASNSADVKNLTAATIYNMKVSAVNSAGESLKTSLSVTTLPPVFDLAWGSSGSGDGQFLCDYWLAADTAGNIYVDDACNFRIEKFNSSGGFIRKWGSNGNGNGQFWSIMGMALDTAGNVYVEDRSRHRINKFDSDGVYQSQFNIAGSNDAGLTIDTANNFYVINSSDNRINEYNSNGNFLRQWGTDGSGDGQLSGPNQLAIDTAGNIYVVDCGNSRVQKFNSSRNYISQWGTNGSGDGQFDGPQGIAIDSSGNVYVADANNHRVQKFDPNGNYISQWGTNGSGDGQFNNPQGIAIDTAGNIYVSDLGNSRIQKFKTN